MSKTNIVFSRLCDLKKSIYPIQQVKVLQIPSPAPPVTYNHLLIAADPVFSLFDKILSEKNTTSIASIRIQLSKTIDQFKEKLSQKGYYHDTILMGAFSLCALIDETIALTNWGKKENWLEHPLTHDIDSKLNAPCYFFDMLDYVLSKSDQYIDVAELMHVCLSLGFRGKYKNRSDKKQLNKIKENVYHAISAQRNDYSQRLSNISHKRLSFQPRNTKMFSPVLMILLLTTITLLIMMGEFYLLLSTHEHEINQQLNHLIQQDSHD